MIENDFLSAFVQELEQESNRNHCLEGSEREAFLSMLDVAKSKTEAYQKAITLIQNPEKKRQFEELYPSLIHLAKENCACFRIFDYNVPNKLDTKNANHRELWYDKKKTRRPHDEETQL